jgi:hypothetical protein
MKKYEGRWAFLITAVMILVMLGSLAFALSTMAKAEQLPTLMRDWYLPTQAIPTSARDLASMVLGSVPAAGATISVCQMDISVAPGTSAINISVYDHQTTPGYFLQAIPITPTSATQGTLWPNVIRVVPPQACKVFPGGLTMLASASGATISMSGRW